MNAEKVLLIADAGATHTRALVATVEGRILGAGFSGAGNAFAIGHAAACRNLEMALGMALKDARIRPARVAFTLVGSASVTHDGRGAEVIVANMQRYLKYSRVSVIGDGRIALEGGLAGAPGVIAVCGTGSIVMPVK